MNLILEELSKPLSVKRKGNRQQNLRASVARIARGAPEVMVKITGFGKSASHIQSHLNYISRKGDVTLETDTGEHLEGKAVVDQYFDAWQERWENEEQRINRRQTLHLVLSMPAHVDAESVRQASREFARDIFSSNEYVLALHTDSNNPHCHLAIKMKDRDGRRINPRKADLQHWRETFAEKVREQGYEAEATSRRTRGITRKREKSAIWHIESGRRANRPRTSKVQAYRIREAVNDIIGTTPAAPRPWEHAIQARQHKIRESWLELAEVLEKQPHPENTRLSGDIRKMVDNMPPVETGRDRMRRELLERFGEKREKTQTPESGIKKEQEPDRRKKRQERELER